MRSLSPDETHAAILEAVQGKRASRKGRKRANCPLCPYRISKDDRDTSLLFYVASGFFKCFKCRAIGRVSGQSAFAMFAPSRPVAPPTDRFRADAGPDDFTLINETSYRSWSMADAIEYLEGRRITIEICKRAHIGVCLTSPKFRGRIVIPHLSGDGSWWGFTARDFTGTQPKRRRFRFPDDMDSENNLYNESALSVETDEPVLAMEGVIDSLLYLADDPREVTATASQGLPKIAHYPKYKRAKRPVVFCLDGDAWRTGVMLARRLRFDRRDAGFVRLPPRKDPNDKAIDPDWLKQQARNSITERIHV